MRASNSGVSDSLVELQSVVGAMMMKDLWMHWYGDVDEHLTSKRHHTEGIPIASLLFLARRCVRTSIIALATLPRAMVFTTSLLLGVPLDETTRRRPEPVDQD